MLRTEQNDYRKAFRRKVCHRQTAYREHVTGRMCIDLETDDLATPLIRRPTGKLSGRWMTYVPYDPSLETPDEGTNTDA